MPHDDQPRPPMEARLNEIARLLAAGYQRARKNAGLWITQNPLVKGGSQAPTDQPIVPAPDTECHEPAPDNPGVDDEPTDR